MAVLERPPQRQLITCVLCFTSVCSTFHQPLSLTLDQLQTVFMHVNPNMGWNLCIISIDLALQERYAYGKH